MATYLRVPTGHWEGNYTLTYTNYNFQKNYYIYSMYTTYHLREEELNEEFLKSVKQLFKNRKIAITIQEEMDETDYLLSNPANAEMLLNAMEDYRQGVNFITLDSIAELQNKL